jgi:hypothetical protein
MILISFIRLTMELYFRIIYVLNTTIMSECKQCNQKPASKQQYITIAVGTYILGAAIYGTIVLFKNLISLF